MKVYYEWITVATFDQSVFAWNYRNRLVDHGIEARIFDEYFVQSYNSYSLAAGGIKVKIRSDQLDLFHQLMDTVPLESPPSDAQSLLIERLHRIWGLLNLRRWSVRGCWTAVLVLTAFVAIILTTSFYLGATWLEFFAVPTQQ